MAAMLIKLKDQGWHLTEDGLKKLSEDGKITDVKELVRRALDVDLREISKGGGISPDYTKSTKIDIAACGAILQVLSIRNVSAPKANEESKTAPRMLQIDLTDGQTLCSALEMDHVQAVSMSTAPGTKVLLKGTIKLNSGMLLLGPSHISVCGGRVPSLYEKWEISVTLSKYAKGVRINTGPGGPPPWISFGQKIQQQQSLSNDKSFKSLSVEKDKEESKESAEFTATRNEAIADAIKLKSKKVFGGGNRQLIDFNVKKIIEKGYTEEQAKTALKYARNNLERAMSSLKRRDERSGSVPNSYDGGRGGSNMGGGKNFKEDRRKGKMEVTEGAKPSTKVSLFDFLEDKIKIPAIPETVSSYTQPAITSSAYSKPSAKPSYNNSTPISAYKKSEDNPFRKPYGKHYDDHGSSYQPTSSNNRGGHSKQQTPPNASSQHNYQSQTSASSSTASSNNPFNLENRSKFENNMSASFANRQKRDDDYVGDMKMSNHRDYRGGKPQSASASATSGNQSNDAKYSRDRKPNDSRSYVKNNNYQQSTPVTSSYNAAANYQQNATKFVKGGILATEKSSNRYEENRSNDRRQASSTTKPYPSSASAPLSTSTTTTTTNINHLVKSTASLKLSNSSSTGSSKPATSPGIYPSSHHANSFEKVFPQISSTFEYNPNKIMGFQNKETNEIAMNVLKSQNFDNLQQPKQQPPTQMIGPPQPNYSTQSSHLQPLQQPAQHYIPVTPGIVNLQPFTWPMKVQDVSFAKYWEDGRYYHAEIMAMTDKTCVVQFMEYGNYEEVLLTDCVPINDVNIQLINQYNSNFALQNSQYPHQVPPLQSPQMPPHQMVIASGIAMVTPGGGGGTPPMHNPHHPVPVHHQQHSQQQYQSHRQQSHHQQQQQQQRFRGERQMYVPPAQRSTK